MKKILTILLITLSLTAYCQEVVEVPGSQQELKAKAKEWAVNAFHDTKEVIQNETDSQIMLKGNFNQSMHIGMTKVWFTMKIEFKGGRYRYEIYDKHLSQKDGRSFPIERANKKYQQRAEYKFQNIIVSLKNKMLSEEEPW